MYIYQLSWLPTVGYLQFYLLHWLRRGSDGQPANHVAAQSAAAAKLASLPMIHQNQDPYSFLALVHVGGWQSQPVNLSSGYMAQYIDEMGKKLDKIDEQKERSTLHLFWNHLYNLILKERILPMATTRSQECLGLNFS